MKTKLLLTGFLYALCLNLSAQNISVKTVEAETDSWVDVILGNGNTDNSVAVQFNLTLPEGFEVNEESVSKEESMKVHDFELRHLDGNSYLFVIYSMINWPLSNGNLLRIPVRVGNQVGEFECSVTAVRSANLNAQGKDEQSVTFNMTVVEPDAIQNVAVGNENDETLYDARGIKTDRFHAAKNTIYIVSGKKILIK